MKFPSPILQRVNHRKVRTIPVQMKYTAYLTLVACVCLLSMIYIMAFFIQRNYNLFMGDELGVSAQVIQIVRHEQRLLETALFVLFCCSISVMFGAALYVTRKLTGPVIALERHLLLYSQGDWTRDFKLRKNDEFKELETLINHLRENLAASQSTPLRRQL